MEVIVFQMYTLPKVLSSVIGRRYLTQFLEQVGSQSLLGYWAAVEELRQSHRSDWHQLGAEIFYTYINTPSPDIKVDKVQHLNNCLWNLIPSNPFRNFSDRMGSMHEVIVH